MAELSVLERNNEALAETLSAGIIGGRAGAKGSRDSVPFWFARRGGASAPTPGSVSKLY